MTRVGVGVDVSKDWLDIATTAAVDAWYETRRKG
jgi:hypothetical protein